MAFTITNICSNCYKTYISKDLIVECPYCIHTDNKKYLSIKNNTNNNIEIKK